MSKKIDLLSLIVAPDIIDKIAERSGVERESLKELINTVEAGELDEATQIFMIIDGKVTRKEIQEALNLKDVRVLEHILHIAPEILEKRDDISDRLLEEGSKVPSRIAIGRLVVKPELADNFPPAFLGQLLLNDVSLLDSVPRETLPSALETLEASEIALLLPEKPELTSLLPKELLNEAIKLVPETKRTNLMKSILLTDMNDAFKRDILYEHLDTIDQELIEIGVKDTSVINAEMAQNIAESLPLLPLNTLLHAYPETEVNIKRLAQILRQSPEMVRKIDLERLDEIRSHLLPEECIPTLENADEEKFLLFFRYLLKDDIPLLEGKHFEKAFSLGLDPTEITETMLKKMQPDALKVVLTNFPNLSFHLNLKELPVSLVRRIIDGLSRKVLFTNLSEFPTEVGDRLYEKLSEKKDQFWEEMKKISEERGDIITATIAHAPKKIRDLYLNTYGDALRDHATTLSALVDLLQGSEIEDLTALKKHVPNELLPSLYLEGLPIDPRIIWDDVRERPEILKKIAQERPSLIIEKIGEISLDSLVHVFEVLEQENRREAFQAMDMDRVLSLIDLLDFQNVDLKVWKRIINACPRFCLLPQAPSKLRLEAVLRIDSVDLLRELLTEIDRETVGEKAYMVLLKSEASLSNSKLQAFLAGGETLAAGALLFILHQLVTKNVTSAEVTEFLRTNAEAPLRDELLSSLQAHGVFGFVKTLVDAGYHQRIPESDIVRSFGQPTFFEAELDQETDVTSSKISAVLLEQVTLERKKKLLGTTFQAKAAVEEEKEVPVEDLRYSTRKEKRLLGQTIQTLIDRMRFELPVFLIMTYVGFLLSDLDLKGHLDEFTMALEKAQESDVEEFKEAAINFEERVKGLGKEELTQDKYLPKAPAPPSLGGPSTADESPSEEDLKKEVEEILRTLGKTSKNDKEKRNEN